MGLMGKSEKFALNIVGNPVWQKVGEHFLTSVLNEYWVCYIRVILTFRPSSLTLTHYLGR